MSFNRNLFSRTYNNRSNAVKQLVALKSQSIIRRILLDGHGQSEARENSNYCSNEFRKIMSARKHGYCRIALCILPRISKDEGGNVNFHLMSLKQIFCSGILR